MNYVMPNQIVAFIITTCQRNYMRK